MFKEILKGIGILIGVLALIAIIGWFAMGNEFFMYKYFAPKMEQARRETFEKSKAYNQGMIQELQNMQFEYIQADSIHQEMLASTILHRVADYDNEELIKKAPDLHDFIQELKDKKTKKY